MPKGKKKKMPKFQIESTLNKIAEPVFKSKDWKEAKNIILEYLEDTTVKDRDKMLLEVNKLNNLNSIHRYFTNMKD